MALPLKGQQRPADPSFILSFILRTHLNVEGENRLKTAVL